MSTKAGEIELHRSRATNPHVHVTWCTFLSSASSVTVSPVCDAGNLRLEDARKDWDVPVGCKFGEAGRFALKVLKLESQEVKGEQI